MPSLLYLLPALLSNSLHALFIHTCTHTQHKHGSNQSIHTIRSAFRPNQERERWSEIVLNDLRLSETEMVWDNLKWSETIWDGLRWSETILDYLRQSEMIWDGLRQYETIWYNLRQSATVWDDLRWSQPGLNTNFVYMHSNNQLVIGLMAQSDWKAFM